MKKVLSLLTALLILMTSLTFVASATSENGSARYDIEDNGTKFTVEFENSNFSAEKQEAIAQKLISDDDSSIQTYNLWCNMFGHNLTTETVFVTVHEAKANAPRCERQTYDVTTCSRCDYYEEEFISYMYVDCCPED